MVMKGIIAQPQGAFFYGKQILDSVLIANKCIEDRRMLGRSGISHKLDMKKVYDHVNWNFLD